MAPKYTVRQNGQVVAGLNLVSADNALLQRLVPDEPLHSLEIDEHTWAKDMKAERYFIVREE